MGARVCGKRMSKMLEWWKRNRKAAEEGINYKCTFWCNNDHYYYSISNINFSYTIVPQHPNYLQKMFCNEALTPKSPSRLGFILIKRW